MYMCVENRVYNYVEWQRPARVLMCETLLACVAKALYILPKKRLGIVLQIFCNQDAQFLNYTYLHIKNTIKPFGQFELNQSKWDP